MEYRGVGCIENLDTSRISSPTNRYSTGVCEHASTII